MILRMGGGGGRREGGGGKMEGAQSSLKEY